MNETISVIIPAYNIESFLPACLESILSQTYRDLEILVIDDGSTDSTLAVAREAAQRDSRINVLHQENGGVTSARLHGLRKAAGDWIGFVDGDDYIDPDMYERLINNARQHDADISHCGYQKHFSTHTVFFQNTGELTSSDRREGLKQLLVGTTEPGLCNKLYRRLLFRDILEGDCVDPAIKNTEDRLMNFYLFRAAGKSVFEGFCPYHYMVRTGSATHPKNMDAKLRDPIRVWEKLLAETQKDPELNGACLDNLVKDLILASTLSREEDQALCKPFRAQARKMLRGLLPKELRNPYGRRKIKLLSLWASLWPDSYRFIHTRFIQWKKRHGK